MTDEELPVISDETMRTMLPMARIYSLVILKKTAKRSEPGVDKIIWEHGRRNFALREKGILPIVCPVNDGSDVSGIGIFNASLEETRDIMDADPGVMAGVFVYEIHACRGFPGGCLPK